MLLTLTHQIHMLVTLTPCHTTQVIILICLGVEEEADISTIEETHMITLQDAEAAGAETDGMMITTMDQEEEALGIEEILGTMIEDTMAMEEGQTTIAMTEIMIETMVDMELLDTWMIGGQSDMSMITIEDCPQQGMSNLHQSCKEPHTLTQLQLFREQPT